MFKLKIISYFCGADFFMERDLSTEEKIKNAARQLFTEKGFHATKSRDIANLANINVALLNYYFRSKQKLYDIIMEENIIAFKTGISDLFGNQSLSIEDKIEKLVNMYIDEFIQNRDLPYFIIQTINSDPDKIVQDPKAEESRTFFVQQIKKHIQTHQSQPIHPAHIIANIIGLTLFPFMASPLLKKRAKLSDDDFIKLMKERKKLIPIWIKSMLEQKIQ